MSGRELKYIQEAFECNFIAPVGPQLDKFEETFKQITGFKHCVAVANGTSAIHLGLKSLGIQQGETVLASTLTFIGSVSPVVFEKANPVFVDCDRATWNMDTELLAAEIERLVSSGSPPRAVLPTDLYGQCCDLDTIISICEPHDIPVLVDSAESVGATYRGRSAGFGAELAAFSFNGNKIITTSNGGILASNDRELVEHCRYLATQAREPVGHYEHREIGFNYRLSNVLAAIGIGQLEVLHERVRRARNIFAGYQQRLSGIDGVTFMPEAEYGDSNRWLSVALIDPVKFGCTHETIIEKLEQANIESRPIWKPMHLQPVFQDARVVGGNVAEELFSTGICLPSGTCLTDSDLDRICELIKSCR